MASRIFRGLGAVAVCMALATPRYAAAATAEEKAGARAAAVEGVKAFKEQRWKDALDMFSRAEGLVHSPVHLLYIARLNAQLGKLVIARETYMATYREVLDESAPPAFQRAREQAQEELKALEPRMPNLTLKIDGAPADKVVVTMDGKEVPPLLVGVPRPVDPGSHEFKASGPGVTPVTLKVDIAEAERKSATLSVKYDEAAAAAVAAAPTDEPAADQPADAPGPDGRDQPPGEEGGNGLRIASYAAFGAGAVGIGLGTIFGLNAMSKQDEANALCGDRGCPESRAGDIATLDDEASSANTIAIVGFVGGGLALAAGATLFILSATGDAEEANRPSVTPFVGVGSAGVAGRF